MYAKPHFVLCTWTRWWETFSKCLVSVYLTQYFLFECPVMHLGILKLWTGNTMMPIPHRCVMPHVLKQTHNFGSESIDTFHPSVHYGNISVFVVSLARGVIYAIGLLWRCLWNPKIRPTRVHAHTQIKDPYTHQESRCQCFVCCLCTHLLADKFCYRKT